MIDVTQGRSERVGRGPGKIGTGQDVGSGKIATRQDVGHKTWAGQDVGVNSYAVGRRRPVSTFVEKE